MVSRIFVLSLSVNYESSIADKIQIYKYLWIIKRQMLRTLQ